ncbi:MAG: hypothetical protein KJ065_07435 [Anaerolineae bacterium]|nr:hypothetical protein [Anaerolineae bacterium]
MLKIPAFRYFPEFRVTAYQDDTQFWKFYLIPDYVSIRRDFNGNPVFLLIKYALGDQDREENPDLPRGGGFMVFDVEMSVREADYPKIVEQLQKDVNDYWNQLKALAESRQTDIRAMRLSSFHYINGMSSNVSIGVDDVLLGLGPEGPGAPPGDAPPKVIISHPTWTEGKFTVSAPQSDALVRHRIAEGPVSLTGNNVVSANMDLTEAGATFMEKTLTNLDGSGATDLTPIQVTYQLKFMARMPPVDMRITADSRSLYMSARSVFHDYEGNGCDEDSFATSDQQLEMAVESGLITVQFSTGYNLPDEFMRDLRSGGLKLVMDMIKEKWFDRKPAEPTEEDDPTKDWADSESDRFYLKSEFSEESMHIEYHEQITSLKDWPVNPQGTLQAFLSGKSASELRKYVRVVDLNDPFFQTLGLTVTCFADWDSEPIAFVETQIRYTGRDENNQRVEKFETFTFTKDETSGTWDPSLIGAKREYEYRYRIGFEGREPGEFTDWETETSPRLNVTVADPGKIAIKVLAGNVDFAQVTKSVQVDLNYSDVNVAEESMTVILSNGQLENTYERYIFTEWDRPVRYRTRFFLKNDQTVETEWDETMNRQLVINEPNTVKRLDVQLVPVGDWSTVQQTIVNLRYNDPVGGYFIDDVRRLTSVDQFLSWAVVLKDPNKRKFEYKILTAFKDGAEPFESAWLQADGDQTLPILVRQKPRLNVKLIPALVDFQVTPVVQATLRYNDPQASIQEVETFALTGTGEQNWAFPIADDKRRNYSYQLTYNMPDKTIEQPATSTDVTALVIPKLQVPEVTAILHPKLIDFTTTPLVEVTIDYQDPVNNLEYSDTLVFENGESQRFRFQVKDSSPKEYILTVTYYLGNGTVSEREPIRLDKNQVIIPRYMPTN